MGVIDSCTPRPEVLRGDLDDAIFAADFGDLIAGRAPDRAVARSCETKSADLQTKTSAAARATAAAKCRHFMARLQSGEGTRVMIADFSVPRKRGAAEKGISRDKSN